MNDLFLNACERLLPPGAVDTTADPPVLSPPTINLAADIVAQAAEHQAPLAIFGGNTSPRPFVNSGTVALSTSGMYSRPVIDTDDFVAELDAGTTVDGAITAAAEAGMEFPLDLFSGGDATVGGAFMTRATGGPRRIGATFADAVLGGRFVVATGEIVTAGGRMIKNVTGYDLTRFFAGSLGMFGIAGRLYVKLAALPETSVAAMMRFTDGGDAIDALDSLQSTTYPDIVQVSAPEGLDNEVVIRLRYSGFAKIVDAAVERAADIIGRCHGSAEQMPDGKSRAAIRRAVSPVFGADTITGAVPAAAVGAGLRGLRESCPDMPVACHAREGRLWFRSSGSACDAGYKRGITSIGGKQPVAWETIRTGGITGLFTEPERAILRSLKQELDPAGIFNPHLTL